MYKPNAGTVKAILRTAEKIKGSGVALLTEVSETGEVKSIKFFAETPNRRIAEVTVSWDMRTERGDGKINPGVVLVSVDLPGIVAVESRDYATATAGVIRGMIMGDLARVDEKFAVAEAAQAREDAIMSAAVAVNVSLGQTLIRNVDNSKIIVTGLDLDSYGTLVIMAKRDAPTNYVYSYCVDQTRPVGTELIKVDVTMNNVGSIFQPGDLITGARDMGKVRSARLTRDGHMNGKVFFDTFTGEGDNDIFGLPVRLTVIRQETGDTREAGRVMDVGTAQTLAFEENLERDAAISCERNAQKLAEQRMVVHVWVFGDAEKAYTAVQRDDRITNGDVIYVPSEDLYGHVYEGAWVMAVSDGDSHGWDVPNPNSREIIAAGYPETYVMLGMIKNALSPVAEIASEGLQEWEIELLRTEPTVADELAPVTVITRPDMSDVVATYSISDLEKMIDHVREREGREFEDLMEELESVEKMRDVKRSQGNRKLSWIDPRVDMRISVMWHMDGLSIVVNSGQWEGSYARFESVAQTMRRIREGVRWVLKARDESDA